MERSEPNLEELESGTSQPSQVSGLAVEEAAAGSGDSHIPGVGGDAGQEVPGTQQAAGDMPQQPVVTGVQVPPDDYREVLEITCFEHTGYTTQNQQTGPQVSPEECFETRGLIYFVKTQYKPQNTQESEDPSSETVEIYTFHHTEFSESEQRASSSLVVPGAQVSPEYGEAVGISFEQTEYTTEGEQRGAQVSHEEHGEAVEISSAEQTKYKTSVKHKGVQVSLGAYGEAVEISSVKQTECMTEIEQKVVQLSPDAYYETVEISSLEPTECMKEKEPRDSPAWTPASQGARVSERDSREIVKLPSFEETEGMTESYGRENPPCTLGNQDVQVFPDDYCETVECSSLAQAQYRTESEQRVSSNDSGETMELSSFEETEDITAREERDSPSSILNVRMSPVTYCGTVEISSSEESECVSDSDQRGAQPPRDVLPEPVVISSSEESECMSDSDQRGAQEPQDVCCQPVEISSEESECMSDSDQRGAREPQDVCCQPVEISSEESECMSDSDQRVAGAQVPHDVCCETVEISSSEESEHVPESEQAVKSTQTSPPVYFKEEETSSAEQSEHMRQSEKIVKSTQTSPPVYRITEETSSAVQTEDVRQCEQIVKSTQTSPPAYFKEEETSSAEQAGYMREVIGAQTSPPDYSEIVEISSFEQTEHVRESELTVKGAHVSPPDSYETVELPRFVQAAYMTGTDQRNTPSWTLESQSNSSNITFSRQISEHGHLSWSRSHREHMENPQLGLAFATSSVSQQNITEGLMEDSFTKAQRSRKKRRRHRRVRQGDESHSHSNVALDQGMKFHASISSDTVEHGSVSDTEMFSRDEPHEKVRHQMSSFTSQSGGQFSASGLPDHSSREYSRHTTRNREAPQWRRCATLLVPNLQITIFPGEDSRCDTGSTPSFIPESLSTSDSVETVLEEIRNAFSRAEEAGARSNVGSLRIPTNRSSNTDVSDTTPVVAERGTLGQRMTGLVRSSNLMDIDSDLQYQGLPSTLNVQRAESQNRSSGSNLNPSYQSGSTAIYHTSLSFSTGSGSSPVFSASSHAENPEIASMMPEDINERGTLLGSLSQRRPKSQHTPRNTSQK